MSRERDGAKMPYAYKVYCLLAIWIDHQSKKYIGSAPVGLENRNNAEGLSIHNVGQHSYLPLGLLQKGGPQSGFNQHLKPIKIMEQQEEQKVYKFNGKEYVLSHEVVKGGCQGCVFYNRLDCAKIGRADICNKEHKIFKRLYKNLK